MAAGGGREPAMAAVAGGGGSEGGQERPVGGGEPRPVTAQLPLQHGDLMAKRQDLGVLILVAHGRSRSNANTFVTVR